MFLCVVRAVIRKRAMLFVLWEGWPLCQRLADVVSPGVAVLEEEVVEEREVDVEPEAFYKS